jgi:hypothetical protein
MSHLFKVVDMLLLRRLKTVSKNCGREQAEDRELDCLLIILHASETVTASTTIRGSWEKVGFSYESKGLF